MSDGSEEVTIRKGKYNQFSELLIDYQLDGETPLFKILNNKRKTDVELTSSEFHYLSFCRETFMLELLAGLGALPSVFCSYIYWYEQQKKIKNIAKMNKYINLCVLIGVPSLNLFMYSAYRRFVRSPPFSKELSEQYAYEISKQQKT